MISNANQHKKPQNNTCVHFLKITAAKEKLMWVSQDFPSPSGQTILMDWEK